MNKTATELQLFNAFNNTSDESQKIFRDLLKAMSEPGYIITPDITVETDSSSIYSTTWAIAQTLLDADCKVSVLPSLQEQKMLQSLPFFTDCSIEENFQKAHFAFLSIEELQELDRFSAGTLESPHESCTLIIQTPEINSNPQLTLSGPGIKTQRYLTIAGADQQHIEELQTNHRLYPCGLDIVFCSPTQITALPRSTVIGASHSLNSPLQESA